MLGTPEHGGRPRSRQEWEVAQKAARRAVKHYGLAAELLPDEVPILTNLATALAEIKPLSRDAKGGGGGGAAAAGEPPAEGAEEGEDEDRVDEAVHWLERVLELQPNTERSSFNLANVLYEHGRHTEAIQWFNVALSLQPASVMLLNNLGNALTEDERPAEAFETYTAAVGIDPTAHRAYHNIADFYKSIKRPVQAVKNYKKVLQLYPGDQLARKKLQELSPATLARMEKLQKQRAQRTGKSFAPGDKYRPKPLREL